mgnify:CR=1 FL=1
MNFDDIESWSVDELKAALALIEEGLTSKNFLNFMRFKLKTTYDNLPILIPWYYNEWYENFKKIKRLKIECSRDHGKSQFASFALPVWLATENPNFSVDVFAYSEDQARDRLRKIRAKIEADKTFQWLIPRSKSFGWSDGLLEFPNGSSIGAFGFNSSYRGRHPRVCIIDDPSKDYAGMPIEEQEKFLLSVIEPAVGPKNQILVMGTPVEYDDLLERLDNHPAYTSFKYPAIKDGKPLWPERYTMADLEQARINAKHDWIFVREYLLERTDADTAVFKGSLIKFSNHYPQELYKVMAIDPAITTGGDATAYVIMGMDPLDNIWVLEGVELRTNEVTEIIQKIFDLQEKWNVEVVGIEAIGFQRILKYWLDEEMNKRNKHFPVIDIKHERTMGSKESRILELEPFLKSGKMFFTFDAKNVADQLKKFNPKSKRNRDDLADSAQMCTTLLQRPEQTEKEPPEDCYDNLVSKLDRKKVHEYFR